MTEPTPDYWFPAKRFGWGWGSPRVWQGWVVLAVFFALTLAGAAYILPRYGAPYFVAYSVLLCVILMGICYAKGERPAWRWGRKAR
jgi:hydrogenase/urease accessory protein HupE